jgi:hypothetical protein
MLLTLYTHKTMEECLDLVRRETPIQQEFDPGQNTVRLLSCGDYCCCAPTQFSKSPEYAATKCLIFNN